MGACSPRGQLKQLEESAKKSLPDLKPAVQRNVFISFQNEDKGDVDLLRGQAKNENSELNFNDHSLRAPFNSEQGDYIRRGLRDHIRQSSVTLVYLGKNTHKSEWVDWEIRESLKLGKGVIAVHAGDAPPGALPAAVQENGVKVVSWSPVGGVVKAIEEAAQNRGEPED